MMEFMRYKQNLERRNIVAGQFKRCRFCLKLSVVGKCDRGGVCYKCYGAYSTNGTHYRILKRIKCSVCGESVNATKNQCSQIAQGGFAYCSDNCRRRIGVIRTTKWTKENTIKKALYCARRSYQKRRANQFFQALAMAGAVK